MDGFFLFVVAAGLSLGGLLVAQRKESGSVGGIIESVGVGDMDTELMKEVEKVLQPRGIRNNNPLNIRWNAVNNWNGQTGKDSGGFVIFDKPENGIRAAAKILDSYARRGIKTMGAIVNTWAPAVENNVSAYVSHVKQQTGFAADKVIEKSAGDYVPLLAAMIRHENGAQPYSFNIIAGGVALS